MAAKMERTRTPASPSTITSSKAVRTQLGVKRA